MSDLLTQCPHCQTSFRVTAAQLSAARGMVRCGSCLGVFSANTNLIQLKPRPQHRPAGYEDIYEDDIAFGDMALDAEESLDEEDDMASALQEAEDLIGEAAGEFEDYEEAVPAPVFETYEEYQETPSLFAGLEDDEDQEQADEEDAGDYPDDDTAEETGPHWHMEEDEDAEDEEDTEEPDPADIPQLNEEFHPLTPVFDEDEEIPEELLADDEEDEWPEPDTWDPEQAISDEPADAGDSADLPDEYGAEYDSEYEDEDSDDAQGAEDEPDDAERESEALLAEYPDEPEEPEADELNPDESPGGTPGSSADKPAWLARQGPQTPEKARLHAYLATLRDEEESLEPLAEREFKGLEHEAPVTLDLSERRRNLWLNAGLGLLSLALLGTLALQFVAAHLDQLSERATFTPWRPLFCAILECPAPVAASAAPASALYSQELLIRTHPDIEDALELSFVFHNDAASPQPFPGLELNFRDSDDTLLANRLFLPDEYLPPELQRLDLMPAQSSIQVILELDDPGAEAVNYTIEFRDIPAR